MLIALASLVAGLVLVALLGTVTGVRLREAVQPLTNLRPEIFCLVCASTLGHLWVTSTKWKLVTTTAQSDAPVGFPFMAYTSLGDVIALFLPPSLAVVTTRTLGMRIHAAQPAHRVAALTVYEQLFELAIPASFLPASVLRLTGVLGDELALGVALLGLTVSTAVLTLLPGKAVLVGLALRHRLRSAPSSGGSVAPADQVRSIARLLRPGFAARLMALSLLRYANLLLRFWMGTAAIGLTLPLATVAFSMPASMLALVLSATPGGLGVVEWGWVGCFTVLGVDAATAMSAAVGTRMTTYLSVLVVAALLLPLAVVVRRRSTSLRREHASTPRAGEFP